MFYHFVLVLKINIDILKNCSNNVKFLIPKTPERRLFNDLNIDLVSEIPADCNWPSVHAAWSEVNKEGKGLDFMLKIFETRFEKGLNVGDKNIITDICNEIEISPKLALKVSE
mgnify:CR=1 FL=1